MTSLTAAEQRAFDTIVSVAMARLAILSEFPRSTVSISLLGGVTYVECKLPWWRSLTHAQRAANAVEIRSIAGRLVDGEVRARVLPAWAAMAGDVAIVGIGLAIGWAVTHA